MKKIVMILFLAIVLFSFIYGEAVFNNFNEKELIVKQSQNEDITIETVVSTRFKNSKGFYNKIIYSSDRQIGYLMFGKTHLEKVNAIESIIYDNDGTCAEITFRLENLKTETVEIDLFSNSPQIDLK